jgi:hypothetical protein
VGASRTALCIILWWWWQGIEIATRRIFLTIGKTWCACKSDHVLFLDRVRFDIWRAVIISLASHVQKKWYLRIVE